MPRTAGFVIVILCFTTGLAQSGQAELNGQVRDQNGATIASATVRITELATNRIVNTTTNDDGIYNLTNLKPGLYSITVDAQGFKQSLREHIKLSTGERVAIDVTLEPGAVSESVLIRDDATLLRPETGSLGQVIESRKIVDIPLNGRNFLSLVSLSAGVAQLHQLPRVPRSRILAADHEQMSTCSVDFSLAT